MIKENSSANAQTAVLCPLCGKPMIENRVAWPGVWICPDFKTPLNAAPPFEYKCTGLVTTDEAVEEFERAFLKIVCQRN